MPIPVLDLSPPSPPLTTFPQRKAAEIRSGLEETGRTSGTSNTTLGEMSTVETSTFGESVYLAGGEDDGDEDEVDFPDSEDEEEDEETLLLREEVGAEGRR